MNRIIDIPNVISIKIFFYFVKKRVLHPPGKPSGFQLVSITSFRREPLGIEIPSFPTCFRKNSFILDEVTFFRSY